MYNEAFKARFLDEVYPSRSGLLLSVFGGAERFERELNTDLSEMNTSEMQMVLDNLSGTRSSSAELVAIIIRQYVRWASLNGMNTQADTEKLIVSVVGKIRSRLVASPYHLKKILDFVFPNTQSNSAEYLYRTYMWLAFIGLTEEEAINTTTDEVDLDSMSIRSCIDGEEYNICLESRNDIQHACWMDFFVETRGSVQKRIPRPSGKYILRGKTERDPDENVCATIRPIVSRAFKKAKKIAEESTSAGTQRLSLDLSFKRVYWSGIFWRARNAEVAGEDPEEYFTQIAMKEIRTSNHVYTKSNTEAKLLRKTVSVYMSDYESWKCAFSI